MWRPTGEISGIPVQRIPGGKGKRTRFIDATGKTHVCGNIIHPEDMAKWKAKEPHRRILVQYVPYEDAAQILELQAKANTGGTMIPFRLVRLALASMVPGVCYAADEFGNVANWKGGMTVQLCIADKLAPTTLTVTIPEHFPLMCEEIDGPRAEPLQKAA